MCFATYLPCILQVNSAAAAFLALIVLCTILAVQGAVFTNAEWNSIEMDMQNALLLGTSRGALRGGCLSGGMDRSKY